ncbi:prepilin-type N-terminal cleavage/methylation domain-containing protein, partial [Candidatus Gracilibacteria bacterium]|nr:prepilin-type N-terminal cleavage/methylation domain-containing protein [Candidatus Gracilibacteria bacterium]
MKKLIQAFTIVELIVVITILAILGTIGFVSFSSHLVGIRDTNRLSQLSTMHEGLDVYSTQNELPTPENSVEVRASGSVI